MSSRRTLLRPGLKAHLVRIESREGVCFYVGGPRSKDRHNFTDLPAATDWFVRVERGEQPQAA